MTDPRLYDPEQLQRISNAVFAARRNACPLCYWTGGFHDPQEHGWTRVPSTILEPGWYKKEL